MISISSIYSVFSRCFLPPPRSLLGPSRVADAAELSVSEAADSSGGVHLLSDTLWWKRPLFDLSGPHQLHREERDPLLPAEEPDQAERRRSTVTAGTSDLGFSLADSDIWKTRWLVSNIMLINYTLCKNTDRKITLTSRNAEIKSTLILQCKWKVKKKIFFCIIILNVLFFYMTVG